MLNNAYRVQSYSHAWGGFIDYDEARIFDTFRAAEKFAFEQMMTGSVFFEQMRILCPAPKTSVQYRRLADKKRYSKTTATSVRIHQFPKSRP